MAARVAALGGIRSVVLGGFNEHSAEVHRFVERAARAGAEALVKEKGGGLEEARAALRMRYRRRLAVGAWRDLHNHIHARIRYVNPSPAAEAKLVAQRAREDLRWQVTRLAVRHRRRKNACVGD